METHPILQKKIEELGFCTEFLEACKKNRFETLAEIIKYSASELLRLPGFNVHRIMELYGFLKENRLAKLLKD